MKTEEELTSPCWTSKVKENWISTTSDISMSNSSTATLMSNWSRSSTQLVDMELRLSLGRSSTSSSKEKLIEEDSLSDLSNSHLYPLNIALNTAHTQ